MPNLSTLWQRALLLQAIRQFFIDRGYLEVDTPVRLPVFIPEAYIVPERSESWFLQASPEQCMKRLLAAGCHKIFQICRCFRKGERGSRHLPEFTMLEWYRVDSDYTDLMNECEDLLIFVAGILSGSGDCREIQRKSATGAARTISLRKPWEKITVAEAFRRHATVPLAEALRNDTFDEILCREIEPHLGRFAPAFLYDYPASLGSLARNREDDSSVAERFEIYIDGIELANGFSELTDPVEQRHRFAMEQEKALRNGRDHGPMPDKFLRDLEQMGPAAGIALGIDRLAMVLLDAASIDDVIPFPPEEL